MNNNIHFLLNYVATTVIYFIENKIGFDESEIQLIRYKRLNIKFKTKKSIRTLHRILKCILPGNLSCLIN